MSPDFGALIHRLKQGISAVELAYIPHKRWPLPTRDYEATKRLRISVLDSSFNPPTLAHLALANISPSHRHGSTDSLIPPSSTTFDAKLLLLSVRNADKTLKSSDATYIQRLEMMTLLANEVSRGNGQGPSHSAHDPLTPDETIHPETNIAVAIIDEPTFVGKSRALQDYLQQRISTLLPPDASFTSMISDIAKPELTFLVGIDTLERILALRYYGSEDDMCRSLTQFLSSSGDGSRLTCARRVTPGASETANEREQRVAAEIDKYLDPGSVEMVDIGGDVESFSSSEVRGRIAEGDKLWPKMVPSSIAEYITKNGLYLPAEST